MNDLQADADLCVKCGLCLPHCPTYNKTGNENESPRGRISLIQAWASKQLPATEKLFEHIDNCLLCRSCEKACPARVPYGRLIDNFRAHSYQQHPKSLALSLLKKISHNKTLNNLAGPNLTFYQERLQKIVRLLKLPHLLKLNRLERLLPTTVKPMVLRKFHFPAATPAKGTVALFTGCMGSLLDQETVRAAIQVLTAAGYHVLVPERQSCCGALDQHDGDAETAERLADNNVNAFAGLEFDAIVTIASGCGSQLQEYRQPEFAGKVIDISQFLIRTGCDLSGQLRPLTAASVCLHTPCTLKNVMREESGAFKLLQQLPGINMTTLPEAIHCCGSAGSYLLEHPQMAQALLDDLLAEALPHQPNYLITSNIGCALHISAALTEQGRTIEVLHPVALIARQLN